MNIEHLLKGFDCTCGKHHECKIKAVVIKADALYEIGRLAQPYNNILIVADKNTFAVCGKKVEAQIDTKKENTLIYESDGVLIPNETSIEKLKSFVTPKTDLILGIGSGVIQDLCKYVSFISKLPYFIVATAPSMDGYASKGAAMIIGSMKVTYDAHVPEAIIADINILKNAPVEMIKSGYGDILGKYSCLNDWKLSHAVNDEYLCDYVYNMTYDMLKKTQPLGAELLKRNPEAIKTLTEALVGVGIAMAYVGNSRPASGSEHHLSHFFEITGIINNQPYFMHGIDVAFSAVYTQKLREKLLTLNPPFAKAQLSRADREKKINEIYTAAADGIIKLQDKIGRYNQDRTEIYTNKRGEICDVLKSSPSSREMIKYLESIELDINDFEKMYGKTKIENAVLFAKDLKDRYSVLWMHYDLCCAKTPCMTKNSKKFEKV